MDKRTERRQYRILMWVNVLMFILVMATTLDGELSMTQFFLGFVFACMMLFFKWQIKLTYKRRILITYNWIDMVDGLKSEEVDLVFDERTVPLN